MATDLRDLQITQLALAVGRILDCQIAITGAMVDGRLTKEKATEIRVRLKSAMEALTRVNQSIIEESSNGR